MMMASLPSLLIFLTLSKANFWEVAPSSLSLTLFLTLSLTLSHKKVGKKPGFLSRKHKKKPKNYKNSKKNTFSLFPFFFFFAELWPICSCCPTIWITVCYFLYKINICVLLFYFILLNLALTRLEGLRGLEAPSKKPLFQIFWNKGFLLGASKALKMDVWKDVPCSGFKKMAFP